MDNEITINGEVYVKKEYSHSKSPNVKHYVDGEVIKLGESILGLFEQKPWPQKGDEFWYVDTYGHQLKGSFKMGYAPYQALESRGNFFQTKEEAQMHSLRLESLSKGFTPALDEYFYYYEWTEKEVRSSNLRYLRADTTLLKFHTKEGCQEWYDKYGSSWLALLNDKK